MTFLASCSKDIKVTSDIGETRVVKQSTVSSYPFDKARAESQSLYGLPIMEEGLRNCASSKEYCNGLWLPDIRQFKKDIKTLKEMPDINIVKYRAVDTNVNGDKSASAYKYVSCLPDGNAEDMSDWADIIRRTEAEDKQVGSNLFDDGSVSSSVQREVCEKYGNI
jgi:hypothetical protein